MTEARLDDGGLRAAFEASMEVPCIREKLGETTFEQFADRVRGMKVLSFYVDGEPIGAAVFEGRIGHIGIAAEYQGKWATRGAVRAILREWGDRPLALVDARNDKAMVFTARLGLRPIQQDGYMVRFQ